jgi:acylphosphatase
MERRRIQFTGRVQGVGFRATTRSTAGQFAVTGWVRNEPDGSVLAEVQGAGPEIDRFLESLRTRMGRNIKGQRTDPCPPDPSETRFEVRH